MSRLALYLLGPPRLERDGASLSFDTRKIIALAAYLAVTGQPHTRESLITLLWPELEPGRARAVLRRNLSLLRKALDGEWLVVDGETIDLDPDADTWVDVDQFRQQLAACETHSHPSTEACPDCLPLLEEAAGLYGDHFLAGFTLRDSAAFDDWQFFQTEGLKDELARALVRLATYHTSQGDFEAAIEYARRWLALDPLHEPAHRHLMVLYAQSGQRAVALRQYRTCEKVLADELGVKPSERTQETYQRLQKGELPIGPSAVEAILERELRVVGECPYRGLLAFREADAPFFFGREAFTGRLTEAVSTRPLVAVIVGSSGSGKSSAVFAGLLPRLRDEGNWLIADLRPGGQPFHALAAALLPALEPELDETDRLVKTRKLAAALSEGDIPLYDVVDRALEKSASAHRLLLLVDQFEELYTLCPEPEVRRRFLGALLATVGAVEGRRESPFVLLLTMRADFMGQALAHRPFVDTLQESSLLLGPMTREELRMAVEKPAEKQGAALEAGLVERLLDDVGEEPGNLPLLEFALTLLWERLDYGWMTHRAYEGIGRVEGALARYAQQVYDGLEEEKRARRVFTQLVQPGEGTEDTRRVATRAELGDENWPLVQHLADKRLVVTGRDETTGSATAEVVHETLIQRWGQLRSWMVEDRTFRTWQERLRAALNQWQATERDEGALLRGAPLVEAEGWLTERETELSPAEEGFIQASIDLRERRVAEQEAQRQRELEMERQRAEEQAQAARRLRVRAIFLAGALFVAAVLALIALDRRKEALVQAGVGLASQALLELEGTSPERAVLLALEALENYPYTWQAEHALSQAVLGSRLRLILHHDGIVKTAFWSPDETRILTASDDGTARIWDADTGEELLTLLTQEDQVNSAVWSASGEQILTASRDGIARVWDASASSPTYGEELLRLSGHSDNVRTAWWSPNGTRILTASYDGTAMIWDANTGKRLLTLRRGNYPVESAVWSPSGEQILTASHDGTARTWDASTGELLLTLIGHDMDMTLSATWSPDGSRIATAGWDGSAKVWDAATGNVLLDLYPEGHTVSLRSVVWSPSGEYIATAGVDGTAKVWDAATGTELLTFSGHEAGLYSAAWSSSGERIVTASDDGTAKVWDVTSSPELLTLSGHEGDVLSVAWSPSGERIVTADMDGRVIMWDVSAALDAGAATAAELFTFSGHRGEANSAAWSPSGEHVATGGEDGAVRIWDATTGELLKTFHAGDFVREAAWSPDGERIAIVHDDGAVRVWDAITGRELRTLWGHKDIAFRVAWSPLGEHIVTVSLDGTAKVWDSLTGDELFTFSGFNTWVTGALWSADGTCIVTHSNDGVGRVWDVSAVLAPSHRPEPVEGEVEGHQAGATVGEERVAFTGHTGFVWGMSWSPWGERVATAGWDGTARVWNVNTGAELAIYTLGDKAYAVDWSPDGTHIVVSCADGTAKVFPAWQTTEELIDYAKECCVVRELTDAEREQFGLGPR